MVTRDSLLMGHIRSTLNEHGVSLDFRQDSASAIDLASRRHWAGLVIDCDDVPGGREAIPQIRNSSSNKHSLIFAVVNGSTSVDKALGLGANFVLSKPVEEFRWRSVLHAALQQMEREHRRYFRYEVDLPVRLQNQAAQVFRGRMKNLSEGGLAIQFIDPVKLEGVVEVQFELPSVNPQTFRAKASVIWSDASTMGLRFLHPDAAAASALQPWLNSLESQLQLRESPDRAK
jgi:CheY-like chemotaxis protein